jgi:hypothetical protein
LVETLGARDLDKVHSFAEFLKARRASRSFAPRDAEDAAGTLESDPAASPAPLTPPSPGVETTIEAAASATEEEATPSSRKRPAAR